MPLYRGLDGSIVQPGIADEAPDCTLDLRVIGVELAATPAGYGEEELEMFSCKHTLRGVEGPKGDRGNFGENRPVSFRITLHTNQGDLTMYCSSRGRGLVSAGPIF